MLWMDTRSSIATSEPSFADPSLFSAWFLAVLCFKDGVEDDRSIDLAFNKHPGSNFSPNTCIIADNDTFDS